MNSIRKSLFETKEKFEKSLSFRKDGAKKLVENVVNEILTNYKKPIGEGFCLAEFYFPFGKVHLAYLGGELFTLVDECDAYYHKSHGYPKDYICFLDEEGKFSAELFYTEIIRELGWIYSLHKSAESEEDED